MEFLKQKIDPKQAGSEKHFQTSAMRAIDFPYKITLIWVIFRRKKFLDPNLNENQKSKVYLNHPIHRNT
jgi:hypothetical protein